MKAKLETKDILGAAARLILGGVFIYAGWIKAVAPPEEFAFAIETYKIIPAALTMFVALTVPWLEIYLGVFLLTGVFTAYAAFGLAGMILGFEGLLLQAIIRKLPVTSCGCFGSSKSNSLLHEFIQNIALFALAALAWKHGRRLSIDAALEHHE